MPIDVIFSADGHGLVYRSRGIVVLDDFMRAQEEIVSDVERLRTRRFLLMDHTPMESIQLTAGDIRILVSQDQSNIEIVREGFIAVAAAKPLVFGLSRMWQLLNHTGRGTYVSRRRAEAVAWICDQMRDQELEAAAAAFLAETEA